MPPLNDSFPGQTIGNLFQYIGDHDPSATEGRLAMTDLGVGDDETSQQLRLLSGLQRIRLRHIFYIIPGIRVSLKASS